MNRPDTRAQSLFALCMLGFVLFNYPILALFNRPTLVLGIPLVYAYIFAAWASLVALMALVIERDGG